MVGRQRLLREHVKTGTGHFSLGECTHECRFVDHAPAGGIDQDDASLHARKLRGTDHIACRVVQSHMQRDDVGGREQIVEADGQRADRRGARGVVVARPGDHLHAEPACERCKLGRDPADADDTERLAAELDALHGLPLAAANGAILRRHGARDRKKQREAMLRDREVRWARHVRDRNLACGCLLDIDVLDAGPGDADEPQAARAIKNRFWKPGERRAKRQDHVGGADACAELRLAGRPRAVNLEGRHFADAIDVRRRSK